MRFVLRTLFVGCVVLLSTQVCAGDEEGYFSFDVSRVNLTFDGDEISPRMLRGRVGIYLMDSPRITLESQLAYNLQGSDVPTDKYCEDTPSGCVPITGSYKPTYFVGMYLGIELPMGEDYYAYAHAGYGSAQVSETVHTLSGVSDVLPAYNETSPSYAIGFAFAMPYKMHGFIEYGRWMKGDLLSISSGVSLGIRMPISRDDR